MPFLRKHCKTDHYNSKKTVKIKPKEGYVPVLTRKGLLYEGYWENDNRQGFGVFAKRTQCKTFTPKYRGDWYCDKKHGIGNGHYIDGGYYVGQWKRNMRFGYGKMWYGDGTFYAGDWKCDKRWGKGLFVDVHGDRYEGDWFQDKKHGFGRRYYLMTGQMQEGAWDNDESVSSSMEDIPFRQTSVFATEYPIQKIMLQNAETEALLFQIKVFEKEPEIYKHLITTKKENNITSSEVHTPGLQLIYKYV